jgi:archaemetzincin
LFPLAGLRPKLAVQSGAMFRGKMMKDLARAALWIVALLAPLSGCAQTRLPVVPDAETAVSVAETAAAKVAVEELQKVQEKLRPLHVRLGKPEPGDWLAQHHEDGQTFAEYLGSKPVTPQGARRVIYVQPVGTFNKTQRKIVDLTAEFLSLYYNRPVKVKQDLAMDLIPEKARRGDQLLTTFILHDLLAPRLPEDAAAYLALTANDLWPGEGWNFVFGQASLRERVGVWSLARYGDPDESEEAYRLCLLRTLKVAAHETGHMFSIQHCTAYECCMCGSNHQRESDQKPLALCPECVAKVCWACEADPLERYRKLAAFCHREKLADEAEFYDKSVKALEK